MTDTQQKVAARKFAAYWKDKGYEKGQSQTFWLTLLSDVLGVEDVGSFITFEEQVKLDHTSFIDGIIPSTHVLIEQKSIDKNLKAAIKQSDGSLLSPFQQAKRYAAELPYSQRPRWIVICNFAEFHVYDMERPGGDPEVILLADLEKEYYRLQFLVDTGSEHIKKEMEISLQAGELVGVLYDALLKQYKDPSSQSTLQSLNKLCVRLVFCLYAEDAGIFGGKSMFHDYLRDVPVSDEDIEIPPFTEELKTLLLENASEDFNWSDISPTIFGAVFESTLNPETRRSGGMHYTSIENIHKLIDPLFLDGLKAEFAEIKEITVDRTRKAKLESFQMKLAGLKFLDPACGSGNFLTETYISLRRLENETLSLLHRGQIMLDVGDPIQVSIGQFYGIEINDFAVTVAKTALWIAESQMMKETEDVVHMSLDFLPLKSYANITEGNALQVDWASVVPKHELNYIMGNPPFVGYSLQSKAQKNDILSVYVDEKGKPYKTAGKIDYVSGWYFKAAQLMQGTAVRTAFVSTNSITQGEQVAGVWKPLYERFGIHIDFAHRTFRWDSEASIKAHVHCVIVGFSNEPNPAPKRIYTTERYQEVENINPYLLDAPNVFIDSRTNSICNVPQMVYGNKPTDGGFLFLSPEERDELLKREPGTEKFIRQIYGATEYINNKARYCLWLVGASPSELRKSPFIMERVEQVRQFRLNSTKAATQRSADTPTLFQEIRHPDSEYIIIPRHSSETRRYIPFGFVQPQIVVNDAVQIIPDAKIYHFGIMMSNVHMAWTRAVCGRIKSDYRYSKDVVYNNFPWPTPTDTQKTKIEQTAQAILDARARYPESSLADLYDELTMPPELRKAHQDNDRAVMQAYGFSVRDMTESKCVAELMKMYQRLAEH